MSTAWKKRALVRQLSFKRELNLNASGYFGKNQYPQILSDDDAEEGANFYLYKSSEWANLKKWSTESTGKEVQFKNVNLKNILRSEHIPFNLFYPLHKLNKKNPLILKSFLEKLMDDKIQVDTISEIRIEFSGYQNRIEYLDDNTSFDAYIEYLSKGEKCGLGFEVKYTETSYPYGEAEKEKLNDENSPYNQIGYKSGIFQRGCFEKLRKKRLKQIWRNHLLGLSMVIKNGELANFHSILLYPQENTYQSKVCSEYSNCLNDDSKEFFHAITFQKLTDIAQKVIPDEIDKTWIEYFQKRY